MEQIVEKEFEELFERYPQLQVCRDDIRAAYVLLQKTYENGKKMLIAGNGGSAADSEHIAGELMKRFKISRPVSRDLADRIMAVDPERGKRLVENLEMPLRAVPLTSHIAITTAYMNDADATGVFAQQLLGFGDSGDVLLAISTSGNSENILSACVVAKALGIHILGLTGEKESLLSGFADICIRVPEKETFKIQELHLPVYHCLCLMLESYFFGDKR
ncbi:MAG: SIS domain-containing protein [Erysipelotrichaceae bacterium]|nr:SIS domain-containing protein [Erysipelotrichaceae bacterium]